VRGDHGLKRFQVRFNDSRLFAKEVRIQHFVFSELLQHIKRSRLTVCEHFEPVRNAVIGKIRTFYLAVTHNIVAGVLPLFCHRLGVSVVR
jgi:hypothetical protein